MGTRQYIGARYVPKFADPVEWSANRSYEALTIVTYLGNSYTSKIPVPATVGDPQNNMKYWAATGNYNAQVEEYRQETKSKVAYLGTVSELKNTSLQDGTIINTGGYNSVNDGGSGKYVITSTPTNMPHEKLTDGRYAILMKESEYYNVLALGIQKNVDVTDKVNSLLDAELNLYFPSGTYFFNVSLSKRFNITGDGIDKTILKPTILTTPVFETTNTETLYHSYMGNFSLTGSNLSGRGIFFNGKTITLTRFENIGISGFEYAFYSYSDNYSNEFNNVHFSDCKYGFYSPLSDHTVNNNVFNFCHFNSNTLTAFTLGTPKLLGMSNYFYGCDFEGNCDKAGTHALAFTGVRNVQFDSCYFERNGLNNAGFEQTILFYNPSETDPHPEWYMNATLTNCNFTLEKLCLQANYQVYLTLIGCLENESKSNSFYKIERKNNCYITFINGDYENVYRYTINTGLTHTWINDNASANFNIINENVYFFGAWSQTESACIIFYVANSNVYTLYSSTTNEVAINISLEYVNDYTVKVTNTGNYGINGRLKAL